MTEIQKASGSLFFIISLNYTLSPSPSSIVRIASRATKPITTTLDSNHQTKQPNCPAYFLVNFSLNSAPFTLTFKYSILSSYLLLTSSLLFRTFVTSSSNHTPTPSSSFKPSPLNNTLMDSGMTRIPSAWMGQGGNMGGTPGRN